MRASGCRPYGPLYDGPVRERGVQEATASPRIGIWGTFDLANFGDLLFPRIFAHELERRLPTAELRVFSPLGHDHPVTMDGGFLAEPLGPWSAETTARLAAELDLVAIGGGEIVHTQDELFDRYYGIDREEARRLAPSAFFIDGLGPENELRCPVVWHAVGVPFDLDESDARRVVDALRDRPYVAVRDELSKERLVRAGVEREIAVVPDSGLVADRVFPRALLEKRLAYLRAVDWYPPSEAPVVVQGSVPLLEHVDAIADALERELAERPVPIVLLETGPCHGDGDFADALSERLGPAAYRMPGDVALEDIAAAIAHARAFVGVSMHGTILAYVHGVPAATLNLLGYSKLHSLAGTLGTRRTLASTPAEVAPAIARALTGDRGEMDRSTLASRIDAHFDRIAELAAEASRDGPAAASDALREANSRSARLRRAHEAQAQRLVLERLRFAEIADALNRGETTEALRDVIVQRDRRIRTLEDELVAQRAAVAYVESARLVRFGRWLRELRERLPL